MESHNTLTYKEEIEKLSEEADFEAKGDARYMNHADVEARLEWAFYRPSGSHPDQVSDENEIVSIMAFNHSRLGAYERFSRVHQNVIKEDKLRIKIRNRSRMLFRAMIDNDFNELIQVLEYAPVFIDLAIDQMKNGRIWNDTYADLQAATKFIEIAQPYMNESLIEGIKRRLQPIKEFSYEEAKTYLATITQIAETLDPLILEHYHTLYSHWLDRQTLHPLQKIALTKEINRIKIA